MKPKLVISNRVHAEVADKLASSFHVVANSAPEPLPREALIEQLADAEALMAFMTDCVDAALLERCPRLRVIACALKGYDNFDIEACRLRGVTVTIVPDLLTAPTAELTVGLMIALARNLCEGDRMIRRNGYAGWRPTLYGGSIDGSTIGLIGAGRVGRAIARRLAGFDCTLVYHDRARLPEAEERRLRLAPLPLESLLGRSDFVVVALPLDAATLHLIDARRLAAMKPGAYLVNPGRGSVVDEEAVADALAAGRLAGYAADVFETEDWARPDRPQTIAARLVGDSCRTVLTPHLGSAVARIRRDIELAAADSLLDWSRGVRPPGAIS